MLERFDEGAPMGFEEPDIVGLEKAMLRIIGAGTCDINLVMLTVEGGMFAMFTGGRWGAGGKQ
jgi:hypothetical protein